MRIVTHTCPTCGTIVAANELEEKRVMKCPGLDCQDVMRFEDIPDNERAHFLENRDLYQI